MCAAVGGEWTECGGFARQFVIDMDCYGDDGGCGQGIIYVVSHVLYQKDVGQ